MMKGILAFLFLFMGVSRFNNPKLFIPLDMTSDPSGSYGDRNLSSTFPSYPSVFSRNDLFDLDSFSSSNEPIIKDIIDDIAKNNRLPNGLQLTEPTSIDEILENEIVESDKFRFVIKASDLKRAIANKGALKVKQVASTVRGDIISNPPDLNDVVLNPSVIDLLSRADVEESDNKVVYRIEVDESELKNIISDEGSPLNEDLVEKAKSKALFYGDDSNKQRWDIERKRDKKLSSHVPISSSWYFLLSKKELMADILGSLIVSSGFISAIVLMGAFSSFLHAATKKILTIFRGSSLKFARCFPVVTILSMSFYLSKYVRSYLKERKYDGIGYKVTEN